MFTYRGVHEKGLLSVPFTINLSLSKQYQLNERFSGNQLYMDFYMAFFSYTDHSLLDQLLAVEFCVVYKYEYAATYCIKKC